MTDAQRDQARKCITAAASRDDLEVSAHDGRTLLAVGKARKR